MKCPMCGNDEDKVVDSRPTEEGYAIRRRRECTRCNHRFTTYEKLEDTPLVVIKKDKSRQNFVRDKVLSGLIKACEKRPVSHEQLQQIVDRVESAIYRSPNHEIETEQIGEMIMSELKELDEVAYVRFASVYRQFKDLSSFIDELQKMIKE